MNKHLVARLSNLPCFKTFWVIFCPDVCSYFCLVCGGQGSLARGRYLIGNAKFLMGQDGVRLPSPELSEVRAKRKKGLGAAFMKTTKMTRTIGFVVHLVARIARPASQAICYGCQACRSVFVKFLVKFDLEFDLKFEIFDGKTLVKFWGRIFLPAREARKISGRFSGRISEKISETSFQISRLVSETSFSRRAVLTIWHRGPSYRKPNRSGSPNRRHFVSLDL